MAKNIRNNTDIIGFDCNGKNIKQSLYADDTTLMVSNLESLENALNTVHRFSSVAGPRLNIEKTEGILLGPLKNSINELSGVKFTNETVRCLGIYLGHNKEQNKEKNWLEKIEKIKLIFERWKNRSLTIFGKILVIKTLAISKLIHSMSMLVTPDDVLNDIEKAIFKFLWDSHDRIKRKTLIGSKENGGIKMLDVFL